MIGKITDDRVFEDAPDEPSTPSLGFGGVGKATDDVKARAVARKRNTYGKALGDVLLQPGQTVESVIRENLMAAFQQAGYQVKSVGDAGPAPLVVDVRITKFWAWFDPGFWAITLNDNIATDLIFHGAGAPVVVSTHVEDKRQAATDDAWIKVVDQGLDAYRAEVTRRLRGLDGSHISETAANTLAAPSAGLAPVASASSQASAPGDVSATEPMAPKPTPVAEATPATVMPSPAPSASSAAVATGSTVATATAPQGFVADTATTPLAQSVAIQLGCGAVQAHSATTFIASCGSYGVLIDCDSGQCRPMHTVNVKKDE
ncbi:hypothetical protein GCM10027066_25760 [Dyella jejuensis]